MTAVPKLAGAPITWGVSELPGWGRQLESDLVLAEIARAGLAATELGPPGFLPDDPADVRERLAKHGLALVGAFVPAVLHRADLLDRQIEIIAGSARRSARAGAEVLVIAAETGAASYESSLALSGVEWETLRRGVAQVQELGLRHHLVVAFHPHYGTVIEGEEQVRRLLATTDVPLCLDTGHLIVAGVDPLAIAEAADGRIAHVHLKDVDAELASRVRDRKISYHEAVRRGLYRPLGQGDAGLATLLHRLHDAGYRGWYVIEQDLVIESDREASEPLRNTLASLRFFHEARQG